MAKQQEVQSKRLDQFPPREMSQAAVASFVYGTLQLLFTLIGAGVVFLLGKLMESFFSSLPSFDLSGFIAGTDVPGVEASPSDLVSPSPDLTQIMPETAAPQITPFEIVAVLVTNAFGILGILTSIVAFIAVGKGKNGNGLALAGFMSSGISLIISALVVWVV